MPLELLLFVGSLFAFIIAMIAALGSYFEKRWILFSFTLLCVVVSSVCMFVELYQWVTPHPHEMPMVIRQPTTPL
jgi:hypothetical protein